MDEKFDQKSVNPPSHVGTPITNLTLLSSRESGPKRQPITIDPRKPRLTVVVNIYYQRPERDIESVSFRFSRQLTEDEQVYRRELFTTPEQASPLDTGWVKSPSMIVVENTSANGKSTLCISGRNDGNECPFAYILPGEAFVFTPVVGGEYQVTSLNRCPYTVTVIPG